MSRILIFAAWLVSTGMVAAGARTAWGQHQPRNAAFMHFEASGNVSEPRLVAQANTVSPGAAKSYPLKPVHIVTAEPGGGADFAARLIAQGLTSSLGQQVVVENQGAANGVIAGRNVARAPADGYTLLYYGNNFWLLPLMQSNVPYDPVRDFSPITSPVISPSVLVVHSSLPVRSLKALIELAKTRPGELNYSSGATGAVVHLAGELFKAMAGVTIVRVAYKGTAPALTALLSGEVQMMFPSTASVTSHVKAGRLRALAVTSARPSALFPEAPTMATAGLPGYEANSIFGIFAPARTPDAIINRIHQDVVQFLRRDDIREKFLGAGQEIVASSPDEFASTIRSDMATMGKLIRDFSIRSD